MTIFENKRLERDTFRKLRDGNSLNQRENVEKNVRLYIDSFVNGYKNIGYIGIYWPLKNEVDIRSLKKRKIKVKRIYKILGKKIHGLKINQIKSPFAEYLE